MTVLPQAVLDAATKAAMEGVLSQHGLKLTEEQVWPIVWIALTDAAPHIAAAERDRIHQLAISHEATATKCAAGIAIRPTCQCATRTPRFSFALLTCPEGDPT